MQQTPSTVRRRGRSETTRRAILVAAERLIGELGPEAVTIEGVASAAGVGKQTIYRGWGGRTALLADALIETWALPDAPTGGRPRDDLVAWGCAVADSVDTPSGRTVMRVMGIASAEDPEIARRLDERFTRPLREHLVALLTAAGITATGGAADAIMGGLLFRMSRGEPSTRADVEAIVDAVL